MMLDTQNIHEILKILFSSLEKNILRFLDLKHMELFFELLEIHRFLEIYVIKQINFDKKPENKNILSYS